MPDSTLGRLLVVDDEVELLNSLADKLAKQGYFVSRYSTGREALAALESSAYDLLLTDLMMPQMDGITLYQEARRIDPDLAGIVMTGQATVQTAVDAMKVGVLDYVLKPFTLSSILPAVSRALETRRLRRENIDLRETVGIYELCNAISYTLDHPTLLNRVVDAALQQCEAEEASVMLATDDGRELLVAAVRGSLRGHLVGETIPLGSGIAGWVAEHRETVAFGGEVRDPRFAPIQPRRDIRAAVSIPMVVGGRVIGVLNVNSTKRRSPFTLGQIKALGILANTGAAALEGSRLHYAARRAEEQYRAIFENSQDGILQTSPDGRILLANGAAARILGFASSEALKASVHDMANQVYRRQEDRVEVLRLFEAQGFVRNYEVQMIRADGGRAWVALNGRAIRDPNGTLIRFETTLTDVTRRKEAERRSSAEHHVARILAVAPSLTDALSSTLQAVGEALDWEWCCVWRVDPDEKVLRCREVWHPPAPRVGEFESFCRSAAIPCGVGLAGRVWDSREPIWVSDLQTTPLTPPADLVREIGYRGAVGFPILAGTSVLGVIEFLSHDAREPDPDLLGTLAIVGTQLGQFMERRRIEEERDRFFELTVDMLCVADFEGRYLIVNPAWNTTLGWMPADLVGRSFLDFIHPDDRAGSESEARRLRDGGQTLNFENRHRCRDGSYRWLAWRAVVDSGRKVAYGSARDITERRIAEQELRLRDRAIHAVTQGIIITDPHQSDNPIIYTTPGFERMTGYTTTEAIGRNCRFLQGPETDASVVSRLHKAVEAGEACAVEILNYRRNKTTFWNNLSIAPIRDDGGKVTHFVGLLTDASPRRNLEAQLAQAQKMDAIGRLAGGVAHDFNNLLTVINGYSDMLIDMAAPDDPSRELLSEVRLAGERSAGLTRQLLAFSRQQVLSPRVLNLNESVQNIERMLGRLIGEHIRLATSLATDLWSVRADSGQIEQVLMNLAVNARDAMPDGGQLTIETQNVKLDEEYAHANPETKPGRHALLAVSDTGCGISPEVMSRVFEPFFTTKDPGKGTGLGLATVHGIIKQSGGHVRVYSEVGVGTTFKIYLPREADTDSGVLPRPNRRKVLRGIETILLVEDDERVRALSRHILAGNGYTVLEASDGEEAIRFAREHTQPIHLLITDVIMPRAGGRQVAQGVTQHHPKIHVIFVSGYTDDAVVRHGVLEEGVHFLQKPYSPVALTELVRSVLDGPEHR